MNNNDLNILTKSLIVIGNFYYNVNSVSSVDEFFMIHNRNISMLLKFSKHESEQLLY